MKMGEEPSLPKDSGAFPVESVKYQQTNPVYMTSKANSCFSLWMEDADDISVHCQIQMV